MRQLVRRLWNVVQRRRFEADLTQELEFHREMKERELVERGAGSADAASAARRALGSLALAQDQSRDVRIWPWLDDVLWTSAMRCACSDIVLASRRWP